MTLRWLSHVCCQAQLEWPAPQMAARAAPATALHPQRRGARLRRMKRRRTMSPCPSASPGPRSTSCRSPRRLCANAPSSFPRSHGGCSSATSSCRPGFFTTLVAVPNKMRCPQKAAPACPASSAQRTSAGLIVHPLPQPLPCLGRSCMLVHAWAPTAAPRPGAPPPPSAPSKH